MTVHTKYLEEGRAKLAQPNGWARGPGDGATCWCIITSLSYKTSFMEIEFIREAIIELHPEFAQPIIDRGHRPSIVDWNDEVAKDVDEVLAVMDLAIAKARAADSSQNLSEATE